MQYGCCTTLTYYDALKDAGYDFIELAGKTVAAWDEPAFSAACRTIAQGGLPCLGFHAALPAEIRLSEPNWDPAVLRRYAALLCRRAAALGARNIGIGSPASRSLAPGGDPVKAVRQTIESLSILCEEAQRAGITILIEAVNYTETNFCRTLEDARWLLHQLPAPNTGMVFDLYHLDREKDDPQKAAEMHHEIRHLHISGLDEKRSFPSLAELAQYRAILRPLKQSGWDGSISIESFYGDPACLISPALRVLQAAWNEAE